MRRFHAARAALAIFLLLVSSAWAGHRTTGGVNVRGHYVAPYTRSAPNSSHTPARAHESHSTSRPTSLSSHPSTRAALGGSRDSHGRIKRSEVAKRDFERHHSCP